MLQARFSGKWWPVAHAYSDGVEIVVEVDPLDGQRVLRWLEPRQVADYRIVTA